MNEPIITINGKLLSEAQAMTVRVALEAYAFDLQTNGLGDDETGKAIASGYLRCVREIRELSK